MDDQAKAQRLYDRRLPSDRKEPRETEYTAPEAAPEGVQVIRSTKQVTIDPAKVAAIVAAAKALADKKRNQS